MAIKAKIATQPTIKVEAGTRGNQGKDGVTFYPNVSENGDLSWTNDGGLSNPQTVNIKGDKGNDYVLTDADKSEIADTAAETVVNDYAIRETIYIDVNGICYKKDGTPYPISQLVSKDNYKQYQFVLIYDYEIFGGVCQAFIPLAIDNNTLGLHLSGIWFSEEEQSYFLMRFEEDSGIAQPVELKFYKTKFVGDYITDEKRALSVDKVALLGDIGEDTMKEYVDKQIANMETSSTVPTEDAYVVGRKSTNLFNKSTVIGDHRVVPATGALSALTGYSTSDFIPVIAGQTYTVNAAFAYNAFYDSNKEYVSYIAYSNSFVAPEGVSYFRCTVKNSSLDIFQMNEGDVLLPYEDYGTYLTMQPFSQDVLLALKESLNNIGEKSFDTTYLSNVRKHLMNPFIKTQIKLVGDSITAGQAGTGYELTGETIGGGGGKKANNLDATCWSNMLYHYVDYNFNRDFDVPTLHEAIKYNTTGTFMDTTYTENGKTVYYQYALFNNNKVVNNAIEFSFYGDHFSVFHRKSSIDGIFGIYVDGVLMQMVDCYAETESHRNRTDVTGLTMGEHTVNIAMTNTSNAAATSKQIRIEGFAVQKVAVVKPWGISGTTSEAAYNINGRYSVDDDFVIMQYGTNDRHIGFNADMTYHNLVKAAEMIEETYGAKVIFMCSCPAAESFEFGDDATRNFHMWDIKNAVGKAAKYFGRPYIDNYDVFFRYAENHDITFEDLLFDGLHPNDLGYKVMFENILRALDLPILPSYVENRSIGGTV